MLRLNLTNVFACAEDWTNDLPGSWSGGEIHFDAEKG
jgi:hypothetical protein